MRGPVADDVLLREEQEAGAPNEHVREYGLRVWCETRRARARRQLRR